MAADEKTLPDQLTFHFIKSNLHRVIHSDGAWGGITPNGYLALTFYNERQPIPQTTARQLEADGETYGEETVRLQKENLVREVECTVMMDERAARSLKVWLDSKIDQFDRIAQVIARTE